VIVDELHSRLPSLSLLLATRLLLGCMLLAARSFRRHYG
jgi:hypothetical protein